VGEYISPPFVVGAVGMWEALFAFHISIAQGSAELRIAMICSSVYRLFFIPVLPFRLRENPSFPWLSFSGAGQRG
jgi:hypothetical protein